MSVLAFIFSSDSFAQAYRRLRYLKRFEKWRARRADEIKSTRAILEEKRTRLAALSAQAASERNALAGERTRLETSQAETEKIVGELRSEGGALQQVMAQQRRRAANLESELEAVIAREAARRAAEEEARRAAEAEAARREAARKAAEAEEAARREAARRAAEEEAAKSAAPAADKPADKPAPAKKKDKKKDGKGKTTKPVKHSGGAASGSASGGKTVAPAASGGSASTLHTPDGASDKGNASSAVVSGTDFASLKGRLPFPISGSYTIVKKFGRQKHPSLPHVETNNAGIDMETAKTAAVRSVADGEVSAVFRPDGYNSVVVIRHGSFMTVYANLGTVSVTTGQKIKAGQNIGTVYSDPNDKGRSVLHFEIRNGRQKENPELWLRR